MSTEKKSLRPETNNLRRIFCERNYKNIKAMAIELGENPIQFRWYFRKEKPVIPKIEKLEKWKNILGIGIEEFFLICDPVVWPRPLKPHNSVHKKGLSYRQTIQLRETLLMLVAEERLDGEEEISWFLRGEPEKKDD